MIYLDLYERECVCVCVYVRDRKREGEERKNWDISGVSVRHEDRTAEIS